MPARRRRRSRCATSACSTAARRSSTASPSTCRRTRSSASSARRNPARRSLLRCINRTIEFTAGAKVSGHDQGRRRGRAEAAERLRAAPQDRHGGAAAGRACRSPSTTTSPSRRARPACATRPTLDALVETCLRQAALWDEVKDRLDSLGTKLSGGQQQRLTIARALSHQPEILCLDEFSIAIDPVTTMRIEDVLKELQEGDDHHPRHQPGAAGAAPGRPHHVPVERRDRRGGPQRGHLLRPARQTGGPTST